MHLYNGYLVRAGYEQELEKENRKKELIPFLIELGYSNNQSSKLLEDNTVFKVVDVLDKYYHLTLEKSADEDAKIFCKTMNKSINQTND